MLRFLRKKKKEETPKPRACDDPTSIGNVLLSIGKVTQEQLADALTRQASYGDALLGTILKDDGIITADDVAKAIKLQEKMRSGNVLDAELDILEMKLSESATVAKQMSTAIEDRKQVLRDAGEKSDIFLIPFPIVSNGRG
jgi:hypothetical protein